MGGGGLLNGQNLLSVTKVIFKKTPWPLFMDGVQLPQGYRATSGRQFTFHN